MLSWPLGMDLRPSPEYSSGQIRASGKPIFSAVLLMTPRLIGELGGDDCSPNYRGTFTGLFGLGELARVIMPGEPRACRGACGFSRGRPRLAGAAFGRKGWAPLTEGAFETKPQGIFRQGLSARSWPPETQAQRPAESSCGTGSFKRHERKPLGHK